MIPYLIPILVTLLAALYYDWTGRVRGRKAVWYLLFVYLVLLIGLRYKVGADTLNYMDYFAWAPDLSGWKFWDAANPYEPFFTFLVSVGKSFSDEFYAFQLVHALILNTCIFYFISHNTKYRFSALFFCFLLYYFYFSTEVLRESLAVFVFALNYKNYQNNRWFRYYCWALVACLFHISAVFLLVLPFAKWLRLDWKFGLLSLFFVLVLFNMGSVFALLEDISRIGEKVNSYEDVHFVGFLWMGLRFLQYTLVPLCILAFGKKVLHMEVKYEPLYCVMALLGIGVLFSPVIFSRFTNYIYPLYALSLTEVLCGGLKAVMPAVKRLSSLVIGCAVLFIYGSYYVHLNFYRIWVPYVSVIHPYEVSGRDDFRPGN